MCGNGRRIGAVIIREAQLSIRQGQATVRTVFFGVVRGGMRAGSGVLPPGAPTYPASVPPALASVSVSNSNKASEGSLGSSMGE